MNWISNLRGRIGAAVGVVIAAVFFLGCGLIFTFYVAPRQKVQAYRIQNLPLINAADVGAAVPGADLLITGRLQNNATLDNGQFVAYELDIWEVTLPSSDDDSDSEPSGSWSSESQAVPDLNLDLGGQAVQILHNDQAQLSGPLHELIIEGTGSNQARYNGKWLPEGSLRYQGLFDDDLVTVLGAKAASGGLIPEEYFAGDRVAFEKYQHDQAKGFLIAGICMIVLAPIVLVGGLLSAVFGRRQR